MLAISVVTATATPLLLIEPAAGTVLYAEEPDRVWHPASLTKLMTAYLVFDAVKSGGLRWDDDVPLSPHARSQPATRIGLRGGIRITVEQAVRGLVLRSANDFAVALAERVAGTEEKFVEAMNTTAKRLGMTRTLYRNPHGLPDAEQVSTARDQALLTMALAKDFPDRAEVFSTPTVRIHKGTFHSGNDLLRTLEGADGMKTGFTCASGYNVVASATRAGTRLVAVVLGAVNRGKRSEQAADLLEAGFAHVALTRPLVAAPASPPAAPVPDVGVGKPDPKSHGDEEDEPLPARQARPSAHAITITPVALKDLAMVPAEALPPHDFSRQVRSGKCRGYSGFPKHEPDPGTEPIAATSDSHPATPTATPGRAARTDAIVKDISAQSEAAAPAAVAPAPAKVLRRAATASTSTLPKLPRRAAKRRAPVEPGADAQGDSK